MRIKLVGMTLFFTGRVIPILLQHSILNVDIEESTKNMELVEVVPNVLCIS